MNVPYYGRGKENQAVARAHGLLRPDAHARKYTVAQGQMHTYLHSPAQLSL